MGFQSKNEYLERADFSWSSDSIRYINTPSVSTRQIFLYVQEAGYFKTRPPYFTERANLHSFLLIYTISGRGMLRTGEKTWPLIPRSCCLINCMDHHYYECLQGQEWEFLWLHYNGTNALGYYKEFLKNGFHVLHDMDPFFWESSMRRILALTMKKDLHSDIIVSNLITNLLTQLLITNSSEQLGLGFMPDFIKQTLKTVENEFTRPLTIDELAGKSGVSKFHFSREFKKYVGTTLHDYLITARINHAKEMLKYTNKSVEQIAYESGFNQASHFIQMFKSREKSTPLQYRKDWGAVIE